jgi:hypothetical protein
MTIQGPDRQFDVPTTTTTPAPEDSSLMMSTSPAPATTDRVAQSNLPVAWLPPSEERLRIAGSYQTAGLIVSGRNVQEILINEQAQESE